MGRSLAVETVISGESGVSGGNAVAEKRVDYVDDELGQRKSVAKDKGVGSPCS
ncbi:MAG: hypothetical protein JW741_13645 [Sedimentisphaerales bacterium]|nr:hypothetical protein [Sedimentisphaerales bacterium]